MLRQTLINRINSLRGLFAIMIVLGHCSMYFDKELLLLLLIHKFNMVSVCFFFMASGISMSYNMEHKKEYLKGFIKNKILLLMIFALITQMVNMFLRRIVLGDDLSIGWWILTGWNWYIYEMTVLYLIFYLCNKYIKEPIMKELLFWAAALMICMVTLYFCRNGSWQGWTGAYYYSTLSFLLGITLYLHFDKIQKNMIRHPVRKGVAMLGIAACSCVSLTMPQDSVLGGIFLRNVMGCCIMLCLFIFLNYVDVIKIPVIGRMITFLTGFSTEIYLYQFVMLGIWAAVYDRAGRNIDLSYVCMVVGFTVVLGYTMHIVDRKTAELVKGK